jgi:hypothetical protein
MSADLMMLLRQGIVGDAGCARKGCELIAGGIVESPESKALWLALAGCAAAPETLVARYTHPTFHATLNCVADGLDDCVRALRVFAAIIGPKEEK